LTEAGPHRQILICGGGPAGLAAALLFADLGWDEIILVERRDGPADFEPNKAFNYQIDPRGQQLLSKIGVAPMLERYGVANDDFKLGIVGPDGSLKQREPPIINPLRGRCYWIRRASFQQMLFDAIASRGDPRIRLLYSHKFTGLVDLPDGRVAASVVGPGGETLSLTPDLILGCDGLASQVRTAVTTRPDVPAGHFAMVEHPSRSSGLAYKVLALPPTLSVRSATGVTTLDDHRLAYLIASAPKPANEALQLAAFPVASNDEPRSANIIRKPDHRLWTLKTVDSLFAFLEKSLPQLDVRALISVEQAETFLGIDPGRFPIPQYARHLHHRLCSSGQQVLLIGDAAHAFPPDLGLGVNSALEDLFCLAGHLEATPDRLDAACAAHERQRLPQSAALVRLVQTVFPEQYGHLPWRLKGWIAGFALRKLLHRLAPRMFDKHAFLLVQEYWLSFDVIETMKQRTDRHIRWLGLTLAATLLALLVL
jgi:2-polyprenyl-6-methoxyphenol hydroxylase-like FAD-dependent oxidoreductase